MGDKIMTTFDLIQTNLERSFYRAAYNVPDGTIFIDGQDVNTIDYDASEDGLNSSGNTDDQVITDSIDDLPMSEIASLVEPVPDAYDETRMVVKACNTCYKFLKEYLNWKV